MLSQGHVLTFPLKKTPFRKVFGPWTVAQGLCDVPGKSKRFYFRRGQNVKEFSWISPGSKTSSAAMEFTV